MFKNFMRIAGIAQAALGVLGTASGGVSQAIGANQTGGIFNLVSGAALGFLGLKGTPAAQNVGVPAISGLNGLVGVLGILGLKSVAGIPLNEGLISNLINIGISAWGFLATFMKKSK